MAIDLTSRLDEATRQAQTFSPAVPTLGSGLTGMAKPAADLGFITGKGAGVPPVETPAPGRDASGVITADAVNAESGTSMQRSGGIAGSIDMKGANEIMARENKARGELIDSMIKANGGNGVAILPDRAQEDNMQNVLNKLTPDERAKYELGRLSSDAAIANQGITARGQDLNFQSDLNRNQVALRAQDIGAANDAQRISIDKSRLEIAAGDSARAGDKWGIDKAILQGQAADSQLVRTARAELNAAIASGDPAQVEIAKAKAVAAGVKFDKPNNEFTAVTDSMGMNVTRTNKDTGAVDIINPKTGEVKSIPAPGQQKAVAAPVPAGYTVIGTSGGKRVLQDAKGNRVIEGAN